MEGETIQDKIHSVKSWYHTMELAPGVVTPGAYDLRPYLPLFRFPERLSGLKVLDVGAANGFYSFHFEKLGAERVVATELKSYKDHDFPRWFRDKEARSQSAKTLEDIDHHELHGGFLVAKEILDSRVEMRHLRIYELPEAMKERFDFVFCGSLLHHLRDPVGGLEALRQVMRPGARLVVSTPVDLTEPGTSYALFVGEPACPAWWVPSPEGLMKMCRMAGYSHVEWIDTFEIERRKAPPIKDVIGIVHLSRHGGE